MSSISFANRWHHNDIVIQRGDCRYQIRWQIISTELVLAPRQYSKATTCPRDSVCLCYSSNYCTDTIRIGWVFFFFFFLTWYLHIIQNHCLVLVLCLMNFWKHHMYYRCNTTPYRTCLFWYTLIITSFGPKQDFMMHIFQKLFGVFCCQTLIWISPQTIYIFSNSPITTLLWNDLANIWTIHSEFKSISTHCTSTATLLWLEVIAEKSNMSSNEFHWEAIRLTVLLPLKNLIAFCSRQMLHKLLPLND